MRLEIKILNVVRVLHSCFNSWIIGKIVKLHNKNSIFYDKKNNVHGKFELDTGNQ